MDSKATAVEIPPFTTDQIKRRKLVDLNDDENNLTTSHKSSPQSSPTIQKVSPNHVEVSKDDEVMDSSCDNITDTSSGFVDDSSKRYPNPDAPMQSIRDMMNSISAARLARKDFMATATIDQLTHRIQLMGTSNSKANLKHLYGYDDDQGNTFLHPEEALYLLETGKLEIRINEIPISIMKARALFLHDSSTWLSAERPYDGKTCTDEEYAVYKYLASRGYRLRRCKLPSDPNIIKSTESSTKGNTQDTANVIQKEKINVIDDVEMKSNTEEGLPINKESLATEMEEFNDDTLSAQHRGLKRKIASINPLSLDEPEALDIELDDLTKEQPTSSSSTPKVSHIPINVDGDTLSSTSAKEADTATGAKDDMIFTSAMDSASSQSPEVTIYDEKILEDKGKDSSTGKNKSGLKFIDGEPTFNEPAFQIGSSSSSSNSSVDEPMPSTSRGLSTSKDSYTVVEVDSDVEFIDEVIFPTTQVEIEEVDTSGFDYDSTIELDEEDCPVIEEEEDDDDCYYADDTNSSTGPRVTTNSVQLIDLVSSDDEEMKEEENVIKMFASDIWSKFVPNALIQLGFPPASLLPKEIHRESVVSNTYEFNMKDQGDQSDLELEKIVDELKIDGESKELPSSSSNNNKSSALPSVKNWKEWRQHFVQEAHDVFKTSLLGGGLEGQGNSGTAGKGLIVSNDVVERLDLWQKEPASEKEEGKMELNGNGDHGNMERNRSVDDQFTFYLYAPTDKKVNKIKLGSIAKPTHRILIARNADLIPDMAKLSRRGSENIPVLVAIVQDDSEVTFVATHFTPITSLF